MLYIDMYINKICKPRLQIILFSIHWLRHSCFVTQMSLEPVRALCRKKLLPVAHVLVDKWILAVQPVYKLSNVSDDLKWTTNTHVTPFTLTFRA